MIFFCGIPSEPPLRYAIEAAVKAGFRHVIFNQRQSHDTDLILSVEDGRFSGCINILGECHALEAFRGAYLRLMEWQHLPENKPTGFHTPDPQLVEKSRLISEALVEWAEVSSCRILNRASASASNASKPYQAQLIRACGFATPQTLITNCPEEVSDFLSRHGRVVYKSISSIRSIVRELKTTDMARLQSLRALPTQFQEFVPGTNVRVHVVGTEAFATEVETEAVDYRYAGRDDISISMRAIELPADVTERCIKLSGRLDLPLCGIDLKRTPAGEFYCFEVNPSPAYTYYQDYTEQPIAEAIALWLAGE
jgi:glutathione synthase/RimK-type ligase-like ATP-grasp enzyme